jgi:glutamine synthetase
VDAISGKVEWILRGHELVSIFAHSDLPEEFAVMIDSTSHIFIKGATVYIPATIQMYQGFALDEKTSLLRSCKALSTHGRRLIKLLKLVDNDVVSSIDVTNQEFYLVPREAFEMRPDLKVCDRTIIGSFPSNHYISPCSSSSAVANCKH